jgi:hypothetical protein
LIRRLRQNNGHRSSFGERTPLGSRAIAALIVHTETRPVNRLEEEWFW